MMAHPALVAGRFCLGALTWAGIGVQFARHVDAGFAVLNFFSYFTILANGIGGSVLLTGAYLGLMRSTPPAWYERARAASTLYLAVVGIVFVTLLRDVDLGALLPWINTVHHYVLPLAIVIEWLVAPPTRRLRTGEWLLLFVFPLAYVTYTLVRGAVVGWYPYPFFDPGVVRGYGVVLLYVAGMIATFVAVGWTLRWTATRR